MPRWPAKKQESAVAVEEKEMPDQALSQDQASESDVIYVRATRVGFGPDNKRYYPLGFDHPRAGEIFELRPRRGGRKDKVGRVTPVVISAEAQFSKSWMEKVSKEEAQVDFSKRRKSPHRQAIITKTAADRSVI
jgi:hypothetical protein